MTYENNKKIENRGLIFLQELINELGWIFRPINLETDMGLDC